MSTSGNEKEFFVFIFVFVLYTLLQCSCIFIKELIWLGWPRKETQNTTLSNSKVSKKGGKNGKHERFYKIGMESMELWKLAIKVQANLVIVIIFNISHNQWENNREWFTSQFQLPRYTAVWCSFQALIRNMMINGPC